MPTGRAGLVDARRSPMLELRTGGAKWRPTAGGRACRGARGGPGGSPDHRSRRPLVRPTPRCAATRSWSTRPWLDKGYRVGDRLDLTAGSATEPTDPTIVGIAESTTSGTRPWSQGRSAAWGPPPTRQRHVARRRRPGLLGDGASAQRHRSRGHVAGGDRGPASASEWPEEVQPVSSDDSTARGARADRGDGADRGGAARRSGVRGQRPQAAAQSRPDGGDGRYAEAVPASRSSPVPSCSGARPRSSAWCSASGSPGCCSRCSSRGPTTGSGRSRCPWLHLAGVAGFGMLSAFLAAVVPAHLRPAGRRRGAGRPPG